VEAELRPLRLARRHADVTLGARSRSDQRVSRWHRLDTLPEEIVAADAGSEQPLGLAVALAEAGKPAAVGLWLVQDPWREVVVLPLEPPREVRFAESSATYRGLASSERARPSVEPHAEGSGAEDAEITSMRVDGTSRGGRGPVQPIGTATRNDVPLAPAEASMLVHMVLFTQTVTLAGTPGLSGAAQPLTTPSTPTAFR